MKRIPLSLAIAGLLLIFIVSVILGVGVGSVSIPPKTILTILGARLGFHPLPDTISASQADIVWLIRLPRLLLGTAVGASLAMSGVVMQAVVKNPLADPYILGVSSGASLGATLGLLFGVGGILGGQAVGLFAFAFAFGVSLLVMILAHVGGRATATKLLLAGMALSTVCGSATNLLLFLSSNRDAVRQVTFWTLGSLGGAKWSHMPLLFLLVIGAATYFYFQSRNLNLMLLGDEAAISLGVELRRLRQTYLLVSALLIGFVVYESGVIGFVGLIVPHIMRMVLGTDHKKLLPCTCLAGAILLVWADSVSKLLVPGSEVPIGVVISIVGAPLFIFLVVKNGYGGRS